MFNEQTIEQAGRALAAASPPGSEVILFGSRARHDAHAESDIDLLVIQPTVQSRLAEAARLARVIRPLRLPVDIVVIGREEFDAWKDVPISIFHHANRQGRRIA